MRTLSRWLQGLLEECRRDDWRLSTNQSNGAFRQQFIIFDSSKEDLWNLFA